MPFWHQFPSTTLLDPSQLARSAPFLNHLPMRSVIIHLVGVTRDAVRVQLSEFASGSGDCWVYPPGSNAALYLAFYDDLLREADPEFLEKLEASLGRLPDVSVMTDISGRIPGTTEVREFAAFLLQRFRGVASDDLASHFWTLAEIEDNVVVQGRSFFDLEGWHGVDQPALLDLNHPDRTAPNAEPAAGGIPSRRVLVFLAGVSRDSVSARVSELTGLSPGEATLSGDLPPSSLQIEFLDDLELDSVPAALGELKERLGQSPDLIISLSVNPGGTNVPQVVAFILRHFHGIAWDDRTLHSWTLAEIEAGIRIGGHPFFDGEDWF